MALDPHPSTAAVGYVGGAEFAASLASGASTSVGLTSALLERIAAVDGPGPVQLGAVLAHAPGALDEAAARDAERAAGRVRGPLHGLPVLVKDNIEAVGLPGTAGSLALADRPVAVDAPVVAALRRAGLVVLGSTNLSEWANMRSPLSASGWSAVGGLTGNPWALDRSAGGSSSGSGAALAAGLAPFALGTETDGSITCPSSLNGVVGLKPTLGLLPTTGIVPLSSSQDCAGPMARSVADVAALLDALTGGGTYGAALGAAAAGGGDLRLGIASGWLTGHAETDAVFAGALDALRDAGIALVEARVTPVAGVGAEELVVLLGDLKDDLDAYLAARPGAGARSLADVVEYNHAHADLELAHFGQEFLEQALDSGGRAGAAYAQARGRCLKWALDETLRPALEAAGAPDFLVAPAYAPAWKSDLAAGDHFLGGGLASAAPSIAGWPVLCLPMGLVRGLPVGLVLIGRAHSEARLIAAGAAVERALARAQGPLPRPAWAPATRG